MLRLEYIKDYIKKKIKQKVQKTMTLLSVCNLAVTGTNSKYCVGHILTFPVTL